MVTALVEVQRINDKCHAPNLGDIQGIGKRLALFSYPTCPK
jgi:hypothetical protein